MSHRIAKPLAALFISLCLCGESRALDPESTTPYKVTVVVRVADQPLLTKTPIFKKHLLRELEQGLRASLGAMAEVEVKDAADKPENQSPLWKAVAEKGLQAGLDRPPRDTSPIKTHFVNVDYVDGQYEIQARQYDGLTGQASPTVRRERTPDRQFVARKATLLLDHDFGLVGTITDNGDGQTVQVAFKGGARQVPLERWVKPDDVFALVQVGADGRTTRVPWVLLQAEAAPDENGSCRCKLLPKQRALKTAGAGFRCMKLGTVQAPLRLRVIEGGRKGPPHALKDPPIVLVGRRGFDERKPLQLVAEANGYCTTERQKDDPRYNGVVFVSVVTGGEVRAQVALPLVDERTITLPIRPGEADSATVTLRYLWEQSLLNEKLTLEELFKSLNTEIEVSNKQPAMDHARQALDGLNERLTRYNEEQAELSKIKVGSKALDISKGKQRLDDVAKGRDKLRDWVGRLDEILKEENSAEVKEAKASFVRAGQFEADGDYDRAIELYEKVLAKTQEAKLAARLPKLKAAWKPQSDDHRKAREFIYATWPQPVEPAAMKARIQQAQAALDVCRKVNDPFGPRKLFAVANSHAAKLTQLLEGLDPGDTKLGEELLEITDLLKKLITDTTTAVKETPVP